jgi:hypothetical protein
LAEGVHVVSSGVQVGSSRVQVSSASRTVVCAGDQIVVAAGMIESLEFLVESEWGLSAAAGWPVDGLRVNFGQCAGVIQLVECQLPKLDVAGSSPVARSFEVVGFSEVRRRWRAGGPQRFFFGGHFGGHFDPAAMGLYRRDRALTREHGAISRSGRRQTMWCDSFWVRERRWVSAGVVMRAITALTASELDQALLFDE